MTPKTILPVAEAAALGAVSVLEVFFSRLSALGDRPAERACMLSFGAALLGGEPFLFEGLPALDEEDTALCRALLASLATEGLTEPERAAWATRFASARCGTVAPLEFDYGEK